MHEKYKMKSCISLQRCYMGIVACFEFNEVVDCICKQSNLWFSLQVLVVSPPDFGVEVQVLAFDQRIRVYLQRVPSCVPVS